ncbi:hypothetical protein [Streptomyces sp. NPDC086023]
MAQRTAVAFCVTGALMGPGTVSVVDLGTGTDRRGSAARGKRG